MAIGLRLMVAGVTLFILGVLVTYTRLGRLPGDFFFGGKNVGFYVPLTTCILISVVITLLMWILRR